MLMKYQIRFVTDVPNQVYAKTFDSKEERDAFHDEAVKMIFGLGNSTFSFKQDAPETTPILDASITILCSRIVAVELTDWKKSG